MVAFSLSKRSSENIAVKAAHASAAIRDEYACSFTADYAPV